MPKDLKFVETIDDVLANVRTLHAYTRGTPEERLFARKRLKNGKLFVAAALPDGYLFAPSKFAGYRDNDAGHADLLAVRDGRDTNPVLDCLLGHHIDSADPDYRAVDGAYLDYCSRLGIAPSRHHFERRYWIIAELQQPEELGPVTFLEGARAQAVVNRFERDPAARKACIRHYGQVCCVCDFDFEKVYGAVGRDYIHVHHIVPLSTVGQSYAVDPVKDLRPVCPNCHAMLHRNGLKSVDALRAVIRRNARGG